MRTRSLVWVLPLTAACAGLTETDPPDQASLDFILRDEMRRAGAAQIAPVAAQNPALVALGQSLFFDRILSGNRDMSCATCHDVTLSAIDGLSLSVGTGGSGTGAQRVPGAGRGFVPRNAPSMLNQGLGFNYVLWDGRISGFGVGNVSAPAGIVLPAGLTDILAAQAMLPVLSRVEMRGKAGDLDVQGNTNELATATDSVAGVWRAIMTRLTAIQEYVSMFATAYPAVPTSALGFQHAANAIAAYETAVFTKHDSPFDRYLARDDRALTDEEKRGGILFFGKARCSMCHTGALLGAQQFANIGVPQIGPGVGTSAPLDIGRAELFGSFAGSPYQFAFRVVPLRNVELTAPYMHNGAYPTLEAVVRHYSNADSALRNYDVTQLAPALQSSYHGDATTIAAVAKSLDFRVQEPIRLTDTEQRQLVAFLKALTDPSARTLSHLIPASVPSGLPIR